MKFVILFSVNIFSVAVGMRNIITKKPPKISLQNFLGPKQKCSAPALLIGAKQAYLQSDLISAVAVVEAHMNVTRDDFKCRLYHWNFEVFEVFINSHGLEGVGTVSAWGKYFLFLLLLHS